MKETSRTPRRKLTIVAASIVVLALAPGLSASAKGGEGKPKKDPAPVVAIDDGDTAADAGPGAEPKKPKRGKGRPTVDAATITTTPPSTTAPATIRTPPPSTTQLATVVAGDDAARSLAASLKSIDWDSDSIETIDEVIPYANQPTSMAQVVDQIGADELWAAGYTGAGVDVAVIDTGVAPITELSTTNVFVGPDLSLEGNVDEVAGIDTFGHGNHMAGIIAGRTPGADPLDRQAGEFLGIAPDSRVVSVKVADNSGAVDVSQVIAAIDWVVQNRNTDGMNIRVLNLSYNTDSTQSSMLDPLSKAVENAWHHGIVVVVSAGNEGMGSFGLASPATNPYVVAVSAAQRDDVFGWFNPHWAPSGDGVRNPDVLAPGVSITSLRNPGSRVDTENPEGRVDGDERLFKGSGTSQAAAVVSGGAALLIQQRPDLTPDQVKALLTGTATDTFQFDVIKGNGVIDLATAMHAATPNAVQNWPRATGLGSLEAARGGDHVTIGGEELTGEVTVTGAAWDPEAWVSASESGSTWSGTDDWSGSTWSGSAWSGSTWSGSTWSGSTWSGSTWSGSTWSGSTWSGSTWSGSTGSGSNWSGSTWSGSTWSGVRWT